MAQSNPQFNLDLAQRVLDHITLHPDRHWQSSPNHCVLGWTVRLATQQERERAGVESWWRTESQAARLLGIDTGTARQIWDTMTNTVARHRLRQLIRDERRARKVEFTAAERAEKRRQRAAAKAEEARQREYDRQARAQLRELNDRVLREQRERRTELVSP